MNLKVLAIKKSAETATSALTVEVVRREANVMMARPVVKSVLLATTAGVVAQT